MTLVRSFAHSPPQHLDADQSRPAPQRALAFDDGSLTVSEEPAGRVSCRISADPATFMLLGYGRIGQWRPTLTGKLVAYGRKPWLALRFAGLVRSP